MTPPPVVCTAESSDPRPAAAAAGCCWSCGLASARGLPPCLTSMNPSAPIGPLPASATDTVRAAAAAVGGCAPQRCSPAAAARLSRDGCVGPAAPAPPCMAVRCGAAAAAPPGLREAAPAGAVSEALVAAAADAAACAHDLDGGCCGGRWSPVEGAARAAGPS